MKLKIRTFLPNTQVEIFHDKEGHWLCSACLQLVVPLETSMFQSWANSVHEICVTLEKKFSLIVCSKRWFLMSSSKIVQKQHTCIPWQSPFHWNTNMKTNPFHVVRVKFTHVYFWLSSMLWAFRTWFYPIE